MYLEEIYVENTGPISKCHVEKMPFDDNGDPQPVVVVGRNGSGKSIFLSYIVDALMEFAKKPFDDIVPLNGGKQPYYRVVHPMAIRSGASYGLSLLCFNAANRNFLYCEKSGDLDPTTDYLSDFKSKYAPVWKWKAGKNYKAVDVDKESVKDEMNVGAHVFFPASRREDPDWLNPNSLGVGPNATPFGRFNSRLEKPLRAEHCAKDNASWILDLLLDCKIDLRKLKSGMNPQRQNDMNNRQVLGIAMNNVEDILKAILQQDSIELQPNYRNAASSRLRIELSNGQIIPSLQSLSEGQSQLFNLFSTIIRYGERSDINRSIRLSEIKGLVLIDEIDVHLHPPLQHAVVPQLMKLFPKVQFIVSSHSPLFLLGMDKVFGPEGYWILELPGGERISSERYTEFGKAFEYYQDTKAFEAQIDRQIRKGTKPLVLTEGKFDVRYIRTALELLGKEHLLNRIDIEPVGPASEKRDGDGGKSRLNSFRTVYEANRAAFHRPILLIYDCETNKPCEQVDDLWIRKVERNDENTDVKKGIENLLPKELFQDCIFRSYPLDGGGYVKKPDKKKLCKWVCDERRNPDDFARFDSVVKIVEEFVDAFQS